MLLRSLTANLAVLVLGSVAFSVVYFFVARARKDAKIRRMGGVRAYSIARNPFSALKFFRQVAAAHGEDKLLDYYESLFNQAATNTYEVEVTPNRRVIITRDPEHIKTVLTTKFTEFGKGPRFHELWKDFLGDSIFATDGKLWHDSRNLIRPMFIKDRVSDLEIFERSAQGLIGQLPASGETVQLMELLYRMTLDVTTEFLLGKSVGSLENPKNAFVHAFDETQRIQMKLVMLAPFHIFLSRKDFFRHIKTIDQFILPFIQETLALPPQELEKLTKSDKNFTFLHHLAIFTRDPKVMRDQLVDQLAMYPEKWTKLRQEVLSTVGNEAPTYDDLKGMRYLRYSLLETLRLYPAIPYNVRTALTDTALPGAPGLPNIPVVKGDIVSYSPYVMQRRRDLYPLTSDELADPSLFSPERWYNWQPRSWEFVPFNGGPRICVGQNFAMTEMAYFMVRLLQKYERLEYRGEWHAQLHKADVVGRPKLGVPVALFEADGDHSSHQAELGR